VLTTLIIVSVICTIVVRGLYRPLVFTRRASSLHGSSPYSGLGRCSHSCLWRLSQDRMRVLVVLFFFCIVVCLKEPSSQRLNALREVQGLAYQLLGVSKSPTGQGVTPGCPPAGLGVHAVTCFRCRHPLTGRSV
jgi:hypothetical protein